MKAIYLGKGSNPWNKDDEEWVLFLSKYHRNNLLFLLNLIGYPDDLGIAPFTFMNNGDWVGEIAMCLSYTGDRPVLRQDEVCNTSRKEVAERLAKIIKE